MPAGYASDVHPVDYTHEVQKGFGFLSESKSTLTLAIACAASPSGEFFQQLSRLGLLGWIGVT